MRSTLSIGKTDVSVVRRKVKMGRLRSHHLPLSVVRLKENQDAARDPAQMKAVATIVKTDATVTKTDQREMMITIGTEIQIESALTVGLMTEIALTVGAVIETVLIAVVVIETA
jgi:uncharacterized protein (DUF1501 family)